MFQELSKYQQKAIFFAQYHGQQIVIDEKYKEGDQDFRQCSAMLAFDLMKEYKLLLRDISSISDEDALFISQILHPLSFATKKKWTFERYTKEECDVAGVRIKSKSSAHYFEIDSDGTIIIRDEATGETPFAYTPMFMSYCHDWFRANSFAMPYMGITVEQQVEKGWIKLK